MARKRQRKKNKLVDSLQVDLLQEVSPENFGDADDGPGADVSTEPEEATDRWAKAVGQVKPARNASIASTDEQRSARRAADVPASGSGSTPPRRVASARDHASSPHRHAGEPLARARDLVKQGRVQEAIELYLGILTVNPSNLKAHNNLGVLLDELKQFDAALEHFEAAQRLAPDNVEVLVNYASTLTSLARYDEAEKLLERANRLSPEDVRSRLGFGVLYFRRGLYDQAEAELRWVLSRDERNGEARYYRGEALNRLGRFDEAVQELQRAVKLIPRDPRPYYTLGHLYDRQHRLDEAGEMYRQARRLQVR